MSYIPRQYVHRFWHKRNDDWCHAWDIEDVAFRMFKNGLVPLQAKNAILPSGHRPPLGERIRCGTCASTSFTIRSMKIERVEFIPREDVIHEEV